jgi:diguanylate cyclase (GGDEF)-like protein
MFRLNKFRPVLTAGRAWLAYLLLVGFASAAEPHDAAQLLKQADDTKTSDNVGFNQTLKQLNGEAAALPPEQQLFLRYLNAWQNVYEGKYEIAIPQLNAIIDESKDATLRFRADVTVVNALATAAHYQQGYSRLNQLLDLLPQVSDKHARQQGLGVAATLYNEVGQYDLASTYADRLKAENWAGRGACLGSQLKLEALYKSGKLQTVGKELQDGIDACTKLGEPVFANRIRTFVANLELLQNHAADAIQLLQENYAETQGTHYPRLISEFDSLLAQAYLQTNDIAQAQQFAQRAIDDGVKNQVTKPLADAYRVLYMVAQQQGDFRSALEFHERYATIDKGYLTDESAKALAYQMVHQQVQEKKLQIDSLSKQNQVLQLRQTVNKKAAEARDLYLVILLMVLGFIAFWAWRTKRSELKFMKLARRDGLTGIFNRQYFLEAGEELLEYSARSMRDACVVVIDLDHFKLINDTHGHAMGDMVLKSAVSVCEAHLRSVDIFGRTGGEEFAIAMPDCDLEEAMHLAERLRQAIAGLFSADEGTAFPVHASFGVAATSCSGHQLKQLMAHADSALYQAKREGRNRVVVFNSAVGISGGQVEEATERRQA